MTDIVTVITEESDLVTLITPGPQGANGEGVVAGGTTGQILRKKSNADFDTEWGTASGTGDVVGPLSSTNNNIALFDGTTGKLLKDSGVVTSSFALSGHDHTGVYQPAGSYAAASHTHQSTAVSLAYVESATTVVDLNSGQLFYSTCATAGTTWDVLNIPTAGIIGEFKLELTNGGLFTQTWMNGDTVKWDSGTKPTLTSAGTDILYFYTRDGGITWRGFLSAKDSK